MKQSNNEFALRCGKTVSLVSLRQESTYYGLIEGLPTRKRNDAKIQRMVETARGSDGRSVFLIPPVQTAIEDVEDYPFGEPAKLPAVSCVGLLHSHKAARDRTKDCSDLTIIWFQDDFAFPPNEEIVHQILAVDWDALARDWEF